MMIWIVYRTISVVVAVTHVEWPIVPCRMIDDDSYDVVAIHIVFLPDVSNEITNVVAMTMMMILTAMMTVWIIDGNVGNEYDHWVLVIIVSPHIVLLVRVDQRNNDNIVHSHTYLGRRILFGHHHSMMVSLVVLLSLPLHHLTMMMMMMKSQWRIVTRTISIWTMNDFDTTMVDLIDDDSDTFE